MRSPGHVSAPRAAARVEALAAGAVLLAVDGRGARNLVGTRCLSRRAVRSRARSRVHGVARVSELREHGAAAERSRPRTVMDRLKANWRWFAQAALATAPSWWLAQQLFGHPRPIFAPVAGLIAVSTTLGERRRYAAEMVVGIALGVGIADALVHVIGSGTWQIAAIVAGAMIVSVALGGSGGLVCEAGGSAHLCVH